MQGLAQDFWISRLDLGLEAGNLVLPQSNDDFVDRRGGNANFAACGSE